MHLHGAHSHVGGGHSHTLHDRVHIANDYRKAFTGNGNVVANVALLGLVANVVLCFVKMLAGWMLDSAVLLADASHSFSDTFGDLMTLIFLYKSQMKPTDRYPFGYGKLETIGSAGLSIVLLCGSLGIVVHSVSRLVQFLPETWLGTTPGFAARLPHTLLAPFFRHSHAHGHAHTATEPSALLFVFMSIVVKEGLFRFTYTMARRTRSSVLEVR